MDTKLRELERAAACGDAEAEKQLWQKKLQLGNYHPVMFQFFAEDSLASATCGRMFDGYDHSTRLRAPGLGETRNCGPMLPVEGILRSVSVSVNYPGECDYTIEVCDATVQGPGFDWERILAKSVLSADVKAEVNRELYTRIPGCVPIGVRIGGDQRSTFSAIHVMLEIWIPE